MSAFWLSANLNTVLTELKQELAPDKLNALGVQPAQVDETKKLTAAIGRLLNPPFDDVNSQKLSVTLPVFFSAFRLFEIYIFLQPQFPTKKMRGLLVEAFEILVGFMRQYYWLIRVKYDCSLVTSMVFVEVNENPTVVETVPALKKQYNDYMDMLGELRSTPYSYHQTFKLSKKLTIFSGKFSLPGNKGAEQDFVQKINAISQKKYEPMDRLKIYTDVLKQFQEVEFVPLSVCRKGQREYKEIQDIFAMYYFQLLGNLLFANIDAEEYLNQVFVMQLKCRRPENCSTIIAESSGIKTYCPTKPIKACTSCDEIYCRTCMPAGKCSECVSLAEAAGLTNAFQEQYSSACVICRRNKMIVTFENTCSKCKRFICDDCWKPEMADMSPFHHQRFNQSNIPLVCAGGYFGENSAAISRSNVSQVTLAGRAALASASVYVDGLFPELLTSSSRSTSPSQGLGDAGQRSYPGTPRASQYRSSPPSPVQCFIPTPCCICKRITGEPVIDDTLPAGAERWAHKSCLATQNPK